MKTLLEEIEVNFSNFSEGLEGKVSDAFAGLKSQRKIYQGSYERISSLESWRAYMFEITIHGSSLDFFLEAQNDALLSHTFARIGSWRAALQSLRSMIENLLFCLYYKDHPVEFQLWVTGKHQLPISDHIAYLLKHPRFFAVDENISGIALLKKEYPILSKAVHASSKSFRMTKTSETFPVLMYPEASELNKWVSRERSAIQIVNQILLTFFREELMGAKQRNLRKSISLSIPKALVPEIREKLGVRLFES